MMRGGGGGVAFPWPPESGIHKEHEGLGLLIQDKPTLFTLISTGLPTHKIETRRTSRQDNSNRNLPSISEALSHTCTQIYKHIQPHTHTSTLKSKQPLSLPLSLTHLSPSHPHTHTTTVYQLATGRETEGRAEMNVKILTLVIVLVVSLLCSASAGKSGAWRLLPRASPCLSFSLCC